MLVLRDEETLTRNSIVVCVTHKWGGSSSPVYYTVAQIQRFSKIKNDIKMKKEKKEKKSPENRGKEKKLQTNRWPSDGEEPSTQSRSGF